MEDDDLKELLSRLKIGGIFILVVVVIFFIMITRKFSSEESKVLSKLAKEETISILVVKEKCSNCQELKQILNSENINYVILNVDREKYYDTILKKIDLTKREIVEPTLIYIKDKKVYSILVDANEDNLKAFIQNNNLSTN